MRPYALFLITLLLLLQNVQLFMCRQLASKRRQATEVATAAAAGGVAMKRTISGAGAGQAEDLLQQQPGDQIESNYDEYPMVVPKRAALLLDRLIMALHRALEKENSGSQHSPDLHTNNNYNHKFKGERIGQYEMHSAPAVDFNQDTDQSTSYMYSDDDPSVLMDYDFKDLNSINRATGESLMAKGFQRRAQGLAMGSSGGGGGDDIRSLGVATLTAGTTAAAGVVGDDLGSSIHGAGSAGRNAMGSNGRLYWRCYFNAVSCF